MTNRAKLGCIICPSTTSRTFLVHMGGEGFFRFPLCFDCWSDRNVKHSVLHMGSAIKSLRGKGRALIRQAWAEYIEPFDPHHDMFLEFGPI